MNLKKRNVVEENKKLLAAIKMTSTHSNFSSIYIAGKVAHAVRNHELFRMSSTWLKRIWFRYTG